MTREKITSQSMARLRRAGLSQSQVIALGGRCSRGGNCTFVEGDAGFEQVCQLFGVTFPDPPAPPAWIDTLASEEREIVNLIDAGGDGWGDRVHALAIKIGADRLMKLKEKLTGKACNCPARRAKLNQLGRAVEAWAAKWWPLGPRR